MTPKRSPENGYGKSSYFRGTLSNLKGVLSNDGLRDVMVDRIGKYLDTELVETQRLQARRNMDTKTTELRRDINKGRLRAGSVLIDDSSRNGHKAQHQSMREGGSDSSFKGRSKSVLPPIL